jgi:NADH:ubiquinone oxidoreductase subunit 5 (subunit L)/multisubunit Na+/H+ antiporter MnhA subunit
MRRRGFWVVYVVAAIVAVVIVGVTIYLNFFSPYRPEDPNLQYAQAQLVFTIVAIFAIIFTLLFATRQFAQSQRRPDLKLVFADSLVPCTTIQIPTSGEGIHDIQFAVINEGNSVAIWFEVIVDLSRIPWGSSYSAPGWAQVSEQYESTTSHFSLRSFGNAAVFTSAPLVIGTVQFFDPTAEHPSKHEIPYQINGDWGAPQKGSLWLNVESIEV